MKAPGDFLTRALYTLVALILPALVACVIYSQWTTSLLPSNQMSLFTTVFVVLTFWITGIFLLLRRFQQHIARLFFLMTQAVAIGILPPLAYPLPLSMPGWLVPFSQIRFQLAAPLLLHYYITFPVQIGSPTQRRRVLGLLYGLGVATIIIRFLGLDPATLVTGMYGTLTTIAAVAISIYVYLRRANPDGRRRLRLTVFGMTLAIVPTIIFYFIPRAIDSPYRMPEWITGLFLVVAPLSYLYAIAHHHLFEIDRLLNRTLVYTLLSLVILAFYLGPILLFYPLLPHNLLLESILVTVMMLLVGLIFNRIRTWAQRIVDHLFFGGWYDYPWVIDTVSNALVSSLEREQVTHVLTRQIPELMMLHEGKLLTGNPAEETREPLPQPCLSFAFTLQGGSRARWWVAGHRDGEDFSADDRRILKTLAQQAEIALNNVTLVEALRRQLEDIRSSRADLAAIQRQLLRSREDERSRLARDLHDGPIQTLVGLNLQLGMLLAAQPASGGDGGKANLGPVSPPVNKSLADMRVEVRGLLSELRQVCAELRPPMLDMLGLGAAIRALAEDWSSQNGIEVKLDLPGNEELRPLPAEVSVNLYRVVQEALTNIAHHAAAQQVSLSLAWEGACLVLAIRDDGRGFIVPETFHNLTEQGHFGLAGMLERVDLIGGRLALESAPGQGATVRVYWQARS